MSRYTTITTATRIDISDRPATAATPSPFDADITEAVENGRISIRAAKRIQAARA